MGGVPSGHGLKRLKLVLKNAAELPIVVISGLANVAWLCVKKTKAGSLIRNIYFSAYARLKKR